MKEYYGNAASDGIAIGKIKKLKNTHIPVDQHEITDTAQEKRRLEDAVCRVDQKLGFLYEDTLRKAGEENAEIFAMHQMMLKDKEYLAYINQCIEEKKKVQKQQSSLLKHFSQGYSFRCRMIICRRGQLISWIFPDS